MLLIDQCGLGRGRDLGCFADRFWLVVLKFSFLLMSGEKTILLLI